MLRFIAKLHKLVSALRSLLLPFAFRISPFTFHLSPFAFGLTPFAFGLSLLSFRLIKPSASWCEAFALSKILLRARGITNVVNKANQTNKTDQTNKSFHLSSFTLHLLPLALLLLPFTLLLSPDIDQAAQATLAWDSNTKPDPAGYRVCYGSSSRSYYKSVDAGNWPSCTLSGLEEAQTCYFAATAYDIHHNESDFSEEVVYSAPIGILASRGSVHFKAAEGGLRVSGQPFTMDFGGILMK